MATNEVIRTWGNLTSLRLMSGDITKALACFREKTGQPVVAVGLNPKNQNFTSEIGNWVQVQFSNAILMWEVWMSGDPTVNLVTPRPITKNVETTCNKIETRGKTHAGRPSLKLPIKEMSKLNSQGLGTRKIAKRFGVSHMSVTRALKKAEVELSETD